MISLRGVHHTVPFRVDNNNDDDDDKGDVDAVNTLTNHPAIQAMMMMMTMTAMQCSEDTDQLTN